MRILHVVTYVDVDGAFGGPVAVAVAQARALAERGHHVTLVAGWDGKARVEAPGVEVHLFPARPMVSGAGFSRHTSPRLLAFMWRSAPTFDVVHVHLARDLVTVPAALVAAARAGPLVVQTHGMVRPDPRLLARAVDRCIGRLFAAGSVALTLTKTEQNHVHALFGPSVETHAVGNGVPRSALRASRGASAPEIIYCSRLHPRKRPEVFVRMAGLIAEAGVTARYTMVGADEGSLAQVLGTVVEERLDDVLHYEGALPPAAVLERLAQAQVFVLPSVDEPFPMAVLEAMSVGLPTVVTTSTGISSLLESTGGARVCEPSAPALARAVRDILESDSSWSQAAEAALRVTGSHFSVSVVAERLETVYASVRSRTGRRRRFLPRPDRRPRRDGARR